MFGRAMRVSLVLILSLFCLCRIEAVSCLAQQVAKVALALLAAFLS